jgi:membrane fusion protein
MGLFRQAAVEAQRERLQGTVLLLPRFPHLLLCLCLLIWMAALILFLTTASYSRKASVRGWLEPGSGMVRVYPRSEGRLARLLVDHGDMVAQGQALALINGDRILADGQPLEALLLEEYHKQKAALERQLAREEILLAGRRQALERRLESGGRELASLAARLETLDERMQLLERRRQRHESLAEAGHITLAELDELREQALVVTSERQALAAQRIRTRASRAGTESELARLPEEAGNTMDRLRLRLSDLSQEIARLRGNRAYVVQAPLSGRVDNIALQPGQEARYNHPLMTLTPTGAPLVARLLVPVHAAGFIEPGQALAIRYDAFPYQKYGLQAGRIVEVAASASLPTDNTLAPLPLDEPAFRVTARPDSAAIEAHGRRIALKSGMTFSADVMLERRSLLQWLLNPLYSLRGRLT